MRRPCHPWHRLLVCQHLSRDASTYILYSAYAVAAVGSCSALHAVESLLNDDIASAHATEPRSARVRTSVGCFHALVVRVKVERKGS